MKTSYSLCIVETSYPIKDDKLNIYSSNNLKILIGEYKNIVEILNYYNISKYYFINFSKNSLYPLLNYNHLNCRVEYGAIIRDQVILKNNCIIMMGAVINKGAIIGENTMIDMNAVIGSNAIIKDNCHVGAGAIISGNMEPSSSKEVIIEDNCFIGANSVILSGIHIGKNSIIGAGAIVTKDVPSNVVCYGNPAKIKRITKENDINQLNMELRK